MEGVWRYNGAEKKWNVCDVYVVKQNLRNSGRAERCALRMSEHVKWKDDESRVEGRQERGRLNRCSVERTNSPEWESEEGCGMKLNHFDLQLLS